MSDTKMLSGDEALRVLGNFSTGVDLVEVPWASGEGDSRLIGATVSVPDISDYHVKLAWKPGAAGSVVWLQIFSLKKQRAVFHWQRPQSFSVSPPDTLWMHIINIQTEALAACVTFLMKDTK